MFDTFVGANQGHRLSSLSASILLHVVFIAIIALIKLNDMMQFEFMPVVHASSVELIPPLRTEHVVLHQTRIAPRLEKESVFPSSANSSETAEGRAEVRSSVAVPNLDLISPTDHIEPGSFTFSPAVLAQGAVKSAADPLIGEPVPPESIPERPLESPQVQLPILISRVAPAYPEVARMSRVQGPVELDATVDAEGRITDIAVIGGHPLLIGAAIDCVRKWRYQPARVNGHVVPAPIRIVVRFQLKVN
jgi:TonB family protein